MSVLAAASPETAGAFIDLGVIILVLAVLARLAAKGGFSPIPFYLLTGLVIGPDGPVPVTLPGEFLQLGADIGVVLLLFMLGLEYSGEELRDNLRTGLPSGLLDIACNFTPGFVAGLLLGWEPVAATLLGGVTYISSSGVISKVLADLNRLANRETPSILTILVIEDLVMAAYLPLVAVLLLGTGLLAGAASLGIAISAAALVLFVAIRFSAPISRVIESRSNEVVLLSVVGLMLLVAGIAEQLQVSSAVGAFLVGIALSGTVAHDAEQLVSPLRDLFAALFFLSFGLQIDAGGLLPAAGIALALGVVTAATKLYTGWWAARRVGVATKGRFRAGSALVARGEFSIVIAGLGVAAGIEPQLGPVSAAYVLLMAVAGPFLTRAVGPILDSLAARRRTAP